MRLVSLLLALCYAELLYLVPILLNLGLERIKIRILQALEVVARHCDHLLENRNFRLVLLDFRVAHFRNFSLKI